MVQPGGGGFDLSQIMQQAQQMQQQLVQAQEELANTEVTGTAGGGLVTATVSGDSQLKNLERPTANNPLGRVLLAFKGDKAKIEEDSDGAELRITEAVLREVPKLERFQAFLRLCVAAGPLLGLIGTVVGMIITFQSITESGSSDPRLMAHGISAAMIATVLGLGIAIPLLFANAGLASMSRTMVQILDEQSTGMLAESLERAKEREEGGLLGSRGPGGPRHA